MMDSKACLIPAFGELTPEQIALVNENSYVVKLGKNKPIFKQGKPASHLMLVITSHD